MKTDTLLTGQDRTGQDRTGQDYNLGLALLRIWMSFEVLLIHFWRSGEVSMTKFVLFSMTRSWAVPAFMFTAFLLTGEIFFRQDTAKLKKRFYRIGVPQLGWTIIYFFCFLLGSLLEHSMFARQGVGALAHTLLGQLLSGWVINTPMWFLVDLMILTLLFAVIYFTLENLVALRLTVCLGCLALVLQYTGINLMLFENFDETFKYTLGSIFEMLPVACLGLVFARYNILSKLAAARGKSLIICVVCLGIVLYLERAGILRPAPGFFYPGLFLVLAPSLITLIFYLLPLENSPRWLSAFTKNMARYTLGIYCLQMLVGLFVNRIVTRNDGSTFAKCAIIYLLCLLLSFLIAKIPGKWSKYLVE